MYPPDEKDEDDLVIARVIKALHYSFPKTTIVRDDSPLSERDRLFEKFEVFFYLPPTLKSIHRNSIESLVVLDQLGYEMVRVIEDYYEKLRPTLVAPPAGVGIHTETEWRFGKEVLEAEGMLGDRDDPREVAMAYGFWVRFIEPISSTARRRKNAKIVLPPPLNRPDDGREWIVDENGVIREEQAVPGTESREILRSYSLRPLEPPHFYPEDFDEEEEEQDWNNH